MGSFLSFVATFLSLGPAFLSLGGAFLSLAGAFLGAVFFLGSEAAPVDAAAPEAEAAAAVFFPEKRTFIELEF